MNSGPNARLRDGHWQRFIDQLFHFREPGPGAAEAVTSVFLPGKAPLLVVAFDLIETDEDSIARMEFELANTWTTDVLIVGEHWSIPGRQVQWGEHLYPAAGILGQYSDSDRFGMDGNTWSWEVAPWAICTVCGSTVVFHPVQSFRARPCGHYDSGDNFEPPNFIAMEQWWATARTKRTAE